MNSDTFNSWCDQVNHSQTCDQVRKIESKVNTTLTTAEADIATAISALAPLLTPPTDLPGVISWINSMITMYAGPQAKLMTEQAQITAQISTFADTVASKLAELGCA